MAQSVTGKGYGASNENSIEAQILRIRNNENNRKFFKKEGGQIIAHGQPDGGWFEIEFEKFESMPDSTSRILMSSTSDMYAGLPLRYTIGGKILYGRVLSVNSNTSIDIEGAPLTGYISKLSLGNSTLVLDSSKFLFDGAYADASSTDLWSDKNGTDFPWENGPAYLVAMTAKHNTDDTGTVTSQPALNVNLGDGNVFASNLETSATRVRTAVTVNIDNYKVEAGDNVAITLATAAGASPADDADTLQVELIFVRESL